MFNKTKRSINWDEFNDLKAAIEQCVKYALRDSELELNRNRVYRESNAAQETINTLMDCYRRSHFAKNAEPEYLAFIEKQVNDTISQKIVPKFNDPDRMRIMLPVVFFSLIIQNESNNKTVTRRKNKVYNAVAAKIPNVSWHKKNPYWPHYDRYFEEDSIEKKRFSKIVHTSYAKAEELQFFDSSYISDRLKLAEHRLVNMCEYLRFVHYSSDVAASGSFLLDILSATYNEKHPHDTIIIMGCILRLTELFTGTRFLIAGHRDDWGRRRNGLRRSIKRNYTVENLLDEYMIDKYGYDYHKEQNAIIPIYYTGRDAVPPTHTICENKKMRLKDRFQFYYNHISENYEFNIEDVVTCFLQEDVFQRFIAIDTFIIKDAKAIQKIIHLLPELQAANEAAERIIRISDLFENNRSFLSEKFDYYEWMDKDKTVGDIHDMDDMFRIQQHESQRMLAQQEIVHNRKQLELEIMEYLIENGFQNGDLPNGYKITMDMDFNHKE